MTFWPLTSYNDFPTDQTFHQFHDPHTELDLHRITSGFHWALAMSVTCQQGTLTLPDTWYRPPFGDSLMLKLLRPVFPSLPCLFSNFHLLKISLGAFSILLIVREPDPNSPYFYQAVCTFLCCHIYNYNVVERDVKPPINQPNQPACLSTLVSMWSGVRSNTCLLHVTYTSDGIGSGVRCYLCLLHVTSISDGMGSGGRSFKGLLHVTSILDGIGSGVRSVNK